MLKTNSNAKLNRSFLSLSKEHWIERRKRKRKRFRRLIEWVHRIGIVLFVPPELRIKVSPHSRPLKVENAHRRYTHSTFYL